MSTLPTISDKCTGSILASAIGDALGWPNEFNANNITKDAKVSEFFPEWSRRAGGRYWNHTERILSGEYSDDTQMILSVARSIITGNWESTFTKNEMPFWLDYERGGGRALKGAAIMLKNGEMPWTTKNSRNYFSAGGNGATMRILPHVIARANKYKVEDIIGEVIKNSIYTHGHPRAILGATCYAYALHWLLKKESVLEFGELINAAIGSADIWGTFIEAALPADWIEAANKSSGYNYCDVWSSNVSNIVEKLKYIAISLKKGLLVNDKDILHNLECFSNTNGAGDVAILSSLYLASKYANNPTLGIKTAAFSFGADTDTIASITGGLLGMLCGTAWIPTEWKLVQDYNCLVNVAELLLAENMKESAIKLSDQYKSQSNDWSSSPIGKVRLLSTTVVPSGKSADVTIQKIETALGQTIYIKKFERKDKKKFTNRTATQETIQPVANSTVPLQQRILSIDAHSIKELRNNLLFEQITFAKILQITNEIMDGNNEYSAIAEKLKVDNRVVEIIRSLIK